jgi:hypothetical protein
MPRPTVHDLEQDWETLSGEFCSGCGHEFQHGEFWEACVFDVGTVTICGDCANELVSQWSMKHSGIDLQPASLRPVIHPRLRLQVYCRDSFACRYCGAAGEQLTLDHVKPGGPDSALNLVTACASCNSQKGQRTPAEAGMVVLD